MNRDKRRGWEESAVFGSLRYTETVSVYLSSYTRDRVSDNETRKQNMK